MNSNNQKKKIAFIVGTFPTISETFIINQIADLNDRGFEVEIFAFEKGGLENVSQRFFDYKMAEKTYYLEMPKNKLRRLIKALPKAIHILLTRPEIFTKIFNFKKYGQLASSLKLLFYIEPFLGKSHDLVHCHFGKIANKYLIIREILGSKVKFMTSFYGFDVSMVFKEKPADYYDMLKKECPKYIVMSNNMKQRVVNYGFDGDKIEVVPISIDVSKYPYKERCWRAGETTQMISVGRFVEKKGFDDLLRAMAIVKQKATKPFKLFIVGGGDLEARLKQMTEELKIKDIVEYLGYMKIEDLIKYFSKMHLYIQSSKTASDGDME